MGSDPWEYSLRAFKIAESADFRGHRFFDHRLSLTVPTAVAYKLFGVNIYTTNLLPLISSLLIIITVWLALPDGKGRMIGTIFCLTSVPLFKSSVELRPDIIAGAFMALSFYLLLLRNRITRHKRGITAICLPIVSVTLLFIAFLAKLSAYWIAPLWVWAFINDLKSDRKAVLLRCFYGPALITGICLASGYLLFCKLIWNDPFARLKAVQALTGVHLWSWDKASSLAILKRLTISPVGLLVRQYGVPIIVLAFLAPLVASKPVMPWALYALSCLFFFWFGSTSYTRYEPMPLLDRMTLPVLPAFIILAAHLTSRFSVTSGRPAWINSTIPVLLVIAVNGFSFAQHLKTWKGKDLPEAEAISIVQQETEKNPEKQFLLICSDLRSPESLAFYFGYRYPENLRVLSFGELTQAFDQTSYVFVFINRNCSRFLEEAYGKRHFDTEIDALSLPIVFSSGSIVLFRTDDKKNIARLIDSALQAQKK